MPNQVGWAHDPFTTSYLASTDGLIGLLPSSNSEFLMRWENGEWHTGEKKRGDMQSPDWIWTRAANVNLVLVHAHFPSFRESVVHEMCPWAFTIHYLGSPVYFGGGGGGWSCYTPDMICECICCDTFYVTNLTTDRQEATDKVLKTAPVMVLQNLPPGWHFSILMH